MMGLLSVKVGVGLLSLIAFVNGQCEPTRKESEQCSPGYQEVYSEKVNGHLQRTCCDPNHPDYNLYSSSLTDCRYTTCRRTSACNICDTMNERYIQGVKLDYDEILRDPCTTAAGQNGLIGLCCPKNSSQARLASTEGAESHEFPHAARLRLGYGNCGGTIYNKNYILTAAHCLVDVMTGELQPTDRMEVLLGTNMDQDESKEYLYKVKRSIPHKDYSRWSYQQEFKDKMPKNEVPWTWNDIGVLELDREIQFGPNVKSLEIAPKDFDVSKYADNVVSIGWGLNENMKESEHLHKANLLIHEDKDCFKFDGKTGEFGPFSGLVGREDSAFCAGGLFKGKWGRVTREGDSGGPAICRGADGAPIQCGIVSMGGEDQQCVDNPNEENCSPAAFTEVSYFRDWIKQNAGDQDASTFYKPTLYGKAVPKGKYPHQVHITSSDGKPCGGTLISPTKVVTLSQCLLKDNSQPYTGIQITTNLLDSKGQGQTFQLTSLQLYPALERVGSPVDGTANPDEQVLMVDNLYKSSLVVAGFNGRANISPDQFPELPPKDFYPEFGTEVVFFRDPSRFTQLMSRDFIFLDNAECQRRMDRLSNLGKKIEVGDDFALLCGVEKYSGGSTCDRELGGGVICPGSNGKDMLCAIQAFRLCDYSLPNGFVNVEPFSKFIKENSQ